MAGDSVIDENGLRQNVGMVLLNQANEVFWAQRLHKKKAWQFPQGGLKPGEEPEETLFRELHEELGLTRHDVTCLASTKDWHIYHLPKNFQRIWSKPLCVGQRQKWYLLRLANDDISIDIDLYQQCEFSSWRWVDYWYPIDHIVSFKKEVYTTVLKEFSTYIDVSAYPGGAE